MAGPYSPLRSLGQRQLQIQFTLSSTYDTQALGLMGLNGALVAAAPSERTPSTSCAG
jgi:hypothetical protein